jgi:hypothetical protein
MWVAALLILGCGVMLSCNDDDEGGPVNSGTSVSLVATWEVVSGSTARQFNFNSDLTVDLLYEAGFGIRSFDSYVYLLTESQVIFGYTVYNYTLTGDTLRLIRVDDTTVLARDNTAPTLDQWAQPIATTTVFDAPLDRAVDIAWHDNRLWYGNAYSSDYLYKIDVSTGIATDSLFTNQSAWGIGWEGDDLWVSSNGSRYIYRLDTLTGNSLQTSAEMGAWIEGIAFDGQYLWTGSNNSSTIYQFDPTLNTVVDTFYVERAVHGMTYHSGYLYACVGGVVNRIQMSPFQVVEAFRLEGASVEGISHDGTRFWLAAWNNDSVFVAATSL